MTPRLERLLELSHQEQCHQRGPPLMPHRQRSYEVTVMTVDSQLAHPLRLAAG